MDLIAMYRRMKKEEAPLSCGAVIVAAGSAQRMGFDKLTVKLDGIPVLARSIQAFEDSPLICEIVVVTRSDRLEEIASLCSEYGFRKVTAVVSGGKTRTESAFAGVMALKHDPRLIAVHDGARPLLSQELIERCVMRAGVQYAAVPVTPSTDTLRAVDKNGMLVGTYDRESIVRIQTPQVFQAEILKGALSSAVEKGLSFTDDAAAVERMGLRLQSVEGDEDNIKLTVPADLTMAEGILQRRKEARQ